MLINQESIFIDLEDNNKLHLKRFYTNDSGSVIFMLHGSIENGRIFYSNSGKGLAPFLAKLGFDVYVADLRGRGLSTPKIDNKSTFGQTDSIIKDIPLFIKKIEELRGKTHQHWIAHSWGGILLSSVFTRYHEELSHIKSMTFFATKRQIKVFNFEKFIKIDIFWSLISKILIKKYGYLPAEKYSMGSDSETKKSYYQTAHWVKNNPWIDQEDNFDYGEEIKKITPPPLLSITGIKDFSLGHPKDCFNFVKEYGEEYSNFKVLGIKFDNNHDYDHINILTHPKCEKDHFQEVYEWIKKHD
jgi:predicted alpha/beta hydrolase